MAADDSAMLTVELCGRLAEIAGTLVEVPIPAAGCRADAVLAEAAARHPALAGEIAAGRVRLCRDETLVGGDAWVLPGQSVALFPPVSGG